MKLLKLAITFLLMTGISYELHAVPLNGSLGAINTATDKWYIQCLNPYNSKDIVKFMWRIRRTAGTGCVKATFNNTGATATSCSTNYAPINYFKIPSGPGAKFFTINKIPATTGTLTYTVDFFCLDSSGYDGAGTYFTYPQTYTQNQ